jgi:dienelactone hydrolase
MTAKNQTEWSNDAELQRYASAKHARVFDDVGELGPAFQESLRQCRFDLSFLNERFSDARPWREEALNELRRAMALPVHPRLVKARVLGRENGGNHDREEVEFESAFGQRVPATVLIPHEGRAPFPAVVALHDMGGFRAFGREKLIPFAGEPAYLTAFRNLCYGGRSVGQELVARGFLVISIDAMMFGERTPPAQKNREQFLRERSTWTKANSDAFSDTIGLAHERSAVFSAFLTGLTWAGMTASDDMASVDYLTTRPDVDARRIGCVGLSFGAYRTNYLAALDERIAAAVSVCWLATMDSLVGYNVGGAMGGFTLIPGIHRRLDICDIASLACPRPFMAISGWRDLLMHPHGIASAHRKLRAVWRKAGAPEQLGSLCFESPHEFNVEMQTHAYAWLQRWLTRCGS